MVKENPWLPTAEDIARGREHFTDAYVLNANSQIFQRPYCAGYWLYGVEFEESRGWLAYEFDERTFDPNTHKFKNAIAAWLRGSDLPKGYFRLNVQFAYNSFAIGCRKWGEEWYEDADLPRIDELIQYALLGEIRYG